MQEETQAAPKAGPGGLVLLDSQAHRGLRMSTMADYSVTADMHSAFLASGEFVQAAIEFPIVFIHNIERDAEGKPMLSPVAMLGVTPGENLHVDGTRWDGGYLPAVIRRYPFVTAPVGANNATGVFIDTAWKGFSQTEGDALFDATGKPTEVLANALRFIEMFEAEVQKTRAFCAILNRLDLVRTMKADATLPDGQNLSIEGFLTVDEAKLRDLPEASVVELHRSGVLSLIQAHLISLANLRKLIERKAQRVSAANLATPG